MLTEEKSTDQVLASNDQLKITTIEVGRDDKALIRKVLEVDDEPISQIPRLIKSIQEESKVLIASIDETTSEVIGYALFDMKMAGGPHLEDIFTVRKHRKKGNTRHLIEYAQARFHRISVNNVIYNQEKEEAMAAQYKRLGFKPVNNVITMNFVWEREELLPKLTLDQKMNTPEASRTGL